MGIINFVAFGGILVDLVIISMLISNTYWGYRRGLTTVLFKALVFIVSLIIMFLLYKPVAESIMNKTKIDEWLTSSISEILQGTTLADGQLLESGETNIAPAIIEIINSFVREALNISGVDAVAYVSTQLAQFMIKVGTMLLLLIVSRFFLLFIRFLAEIIANLPLIRTFDRSGGLIIGIIKGFLTAYIILALFAIASPLISSWGVIAAIEDSTLGHIMYNNNFVMNILLNLFK